MNRIQTCFAVAKAAGRPVFTAYLTAGFPTLTASLAAADTLLANGAGILEIGIPYHDPAADGPVLRRAASVARAGGVTPAVVFEAIRLLRTRRPDTPLVVFTYYGVVREFGPDTFAAAAAASGADAVLAPDMPPEEAAQFSGVLKRHGLERIPFLSSEASMDAVRREAEGASESFLYAVTSKGMTGIRTTLPSDLAERLKAIRATAGIPVVAGFGLHTRVQIRNVCSACDGFVIGSALAAVLETGTPNDLAAFVQNILP